MFFSRILQFVALSIFLLSLSTQAALTNAQTEAAQKLINSSTRPTAQDVINAFYPDWPTENPFESYGSVGYRTYDYSMLAEMIVRFEQAYPNAVYVGMGRDMVPLVDALDIYYLSLGQTGRALRLDASGITIRNEDPTKLAKFMLAQGVDLTGKSKKRYVLFDATQYATSSQMYQLMAAGYQYAAEHGIGRENLVKTLAGLSVFGNDTVSTNTDPQNIVSVAMSEVKESGVPKSAPHISHTYNYEKLTYLLEWHDSFGKLYENKNGIMVADPGAPSDIGTRGAILHSIFKMVEYVRSPAFLEQMKSLHEQTGFQYEHKPIGITKSCQKVVGQ